MAIDLEKIQDNEFLLKLLIDMEDILDSIDCYAFFGWLDGEIVEGPIVRRHWVSMSLLYPHKKMPDPRVAKRLLKLGVTVEFSKVKQSEKEFHPYVDDGKPNEAAADQAKEAKSEEDPKTWFWMVKITYPRRLLNQMSPDNDFYEDDVDTDTVEDAQDSGIDDESAYNTDEQNPWQNPEENPENPDEMTPGGQPNAF